MADLGHQEGDGRKLSSLRTPAQTWLPGQGDFINGPFSLTISYETQRKCAHNRQALQESLTKSKKILWTELHEEVTT